MSSEGNNLSSIKTETSLGQNEFTPQVLRVRSLAELGGPPMSQKRTLVPNPHVQRNLVRFIKSNLSDNVGKKFILTTSSTGIKYLTPINPGLESQVGKRLFVIRNSSSTKPTTLTTQPTKQMVPENVLSRWQQTPTQQKVTKERIIPEKLQQIIKKETSTQQQVTHVQIIPEKQQQVVKSQISIQPQVTKEQTIPEKLEILKKKFSKPKLSEFPTKKETPTYFDETFSSSEDMSSGEPETHKCAHCQLEFPTQSALVDHLQMLKLQCHSCEEVFASIAELKMHLKQVHKIKGYKCSNCSFFGTSMWDLKLHQSRDHCQEYLNPCEECDKVFSNSEALEQHVRQVHDSSSALNLLCEMCGKAYKNFYTLQRHIESVHQHIKYPCNQCDKILYSKSTFARHLRWHANKEKIVCELCGKTFNIKFDLRVHMRQHTGEKPYQCSICSKAFAKRTTLRQHLLTHSGRRPYVCDICGRSFTQKPGLTGHRKSHPGDLPPMPSLFIDEILKDLPEDAFQNLGPKKTSETIEATEMTENVEGNKNEEGTSKEKDTEEETEKKGTTRKVKGKHQFEKEKKKNSDTDEWTFDTKLP